MITVALARLVGSPASAPDPRRSAPHGRYRATRRLQLPPPDDPPLDEPPPPLLLPPDRPPPPLPPLVLLDAPDPGSPPLLVIAPGFPPAPFCAMIHTPFESMGNEGRGAAVPL